MNNVILFILINLIASSYGARILAYIPTPSYSHQVVYRPLWKELSLRGHQVTLLTTDPIKDTKFTNLTEIDLHFSYDVMTKYTLDVIQAQGNLFKSVQLYVQCFDEVINTQLESFSVQKLLKEPDRKFDVCFIEYIMTSPFAFSKKFGCPIIGITSLSAVELVYKEMGVPTHPSVFPDAILPFAKADSIAKRAVSVIYHIFMNIASSVYIKQVNDATVERNFGKGFGNVDELRDNVSLLFVNRHTVIDGPRPFVPAVIEVGGIHRVPPKPLPSTLKSTLDSAKQGFIYFSLGSNVRSKDISTQTQKMLVKVFSELPYKVLWKFELDHLPNKPDNVIISKWFPQSDVLRHTNIKLFITQGGLQSMEEGIQAQVPMIGIPFFADQLPNVAKMVHYGLGVSLDFENLNEELFKKTINEVITNPRYKSKVKEISNLMEDQPITSLEKAIWWTEYVIRHKGAKHFRSPLLDIPWYQFLLLDVIACLILSVTIPAYVIFVLIRFIIRKVKRVFRSKPKKKVL